MNIVGQVKPGKNMLENLENIKMPKSKKSMIADYQQGKHLSYVIGVYFGDGTVALNYGGKEAKYFRLEVIDKDFRDYAADCCKAAFPCHHATSFETKKDGRVYYGLQVRGVGNYIESITGKRRFVPNFIYNGNENKKAFVEGLLDSEGWVQLQAGKSGNVFRGHVGFAITSEVIHELVKILAQLGVKHGRVSTYTKGRKKALKQINLNIPSFIESGLKFSIYRKQVKIEKFKQIQKIIGTTRKERCSFREQNPGFVEKMVCSELHSDMQRMAEMTIPVH